MNSRLGETLQKALPGLGGKDISLHDIFDLKPNIRSPGIPRPATGILMCRKITEEAKGIEGLIRQTGDAHALPLWHLAYHSEYLAAAQERTDSTITTGF